nr:MAG TPA: hypothetical protein [Caudoviricetes sp.]
MSHLCRPDHCAALYLQQCLSGCLVLTGFRTWCG